MSEDIFTVVTANMFLDKTKTSRELVPAQAERVGSMAALLASISERLDVVAVQEAQKTKTTHNGEELARQLGFEESYWREHNQPVRPKAKRGRHGEHLGLFGDRVTGAEPIETGDNRLALMTRIANTALVDTHLRFQPFGLLRLKQIDRILAAVRYEPHAVIVGDFNFNGLRIDPVRMRLHAAGFHSAFRLIGKLDPITWPTETYREVMLGTDGHRRRLVGRGVTTDGIFVRGMEVRDADVVHSGGDEADPSDHYPLWADLAEKRYDRTYFVSETA